ncbi:MAG: Ig-like domain-containing protein [Tannerellaceae bacterium]|nr:Ig-like domain-containing protein [Tannerellaceae bacterium]
MRTSFALLTVIVLLSGVAASASEVVIRLLPASQTDTTVLRLDGDPLDMSFEFSVDGVPRTTLLSASTRAIWPAWNISWESSNSNIVSVETFEGKTATGDPAGVLSAHIIPKKGGIVTITAKITYITDLSHPSVPTRTTIFKRHIVVPLPTVQFTSEQPAGQADTLALGTDRTLTVVSTYGYDGQEYPLGNCTWTSSNRNVVSVSGNGLNGVLRAQGPGVAYVYFNAKGSLETVFGPPDELSRRIVVPPVLGKTIYISPELPKGYSADTLYHNATLSLFVDALWNGGTYPLRNVQWISSDPQTVSVSSSGVVTAHRSGIVTIALTAEDDLGFGPFYLTRTVVVPDPLTVYLSPALPHGQEADTLLPNQTLALSASAIYNGKPHPLSNFIWTSSASNIVEVSSSGLVTALRPGSATITLQTSTASYGDFSVTRKVIVPVDPQILPLPQAGKQSNILDIGTSLTLTVAATYNNVSYPLLNPTWESSNPSIVSVNNGTLFALQAGTVTITFRAKDEYGFGPFTLTRTVDVSAPPVIEMLPYLFVPSGGQAYNLVDSGQTLQLSVKGIHNGAPYVFVNPTWTSSSPHIVSVNAGLLTALNYTKGEPVAITFHSDKDALGFGPFSITRLILVPDKIPETPEVPEVPEVPETPEVPEVPKEEPEVPKEPVSSVFTILISPELEEGTSSTVLFPTQTLTLSVSATRNGLPYPLTNYSWASSNSGIVSVSGGVVVANKSGFATVSCYAYGEQGLAGVATRSFTVTHGSLSTIEVLDRTDAEAFTYYTLTGQFLGSEQPLLPGIYIRRSGTNVTKLLVR